MKTFRIANLEIVAFPAGAQRVCYLLSPFDGLEEWASEAPRHFGVSIVVITGMNWDDDLTPWPAKGEPPGSPDFKGNAPAFLATLTGRVVPEVERQLCIPADAERTLAGVSLSGLFTLWQWMVSDEFRNIISLSGSFWYDGFAAWVTSRPVPRKSGRACFLLGDREAHTNVKAFRPVQTDTEKIVSYLRTGALDVDFELVPGNHYQYALQRLTRAFTRLFLPQRN